MIVFDIETGPLADEILRPMFDRNYEPPAHPGQFDPSAVKYGNTKDQAKRAEKLAACEAEHAAAVESFTAMAEQHRANEWAAFVDRAALDATTGQVLAIGFRNGEGKAGIVGSEPGADESTILAAFWRRYSNCRAKQERLVGCNSFDFDLPFIYRRSLILGVEVPATFRAGRWFDPLFCDIHDAWLCGQKGGNGGVSSSLDHISRALGFKGKGGDDAVVTGANFHKFWRGTAEQRQLATAYLLDDLEITAGSAARMGFI